MHLFHRVLFVLSFILKLKGIVQLYYYHARTLACLFRFLTFVTFMHIFR